MANYLCILCLSARAKLITQNFGYFYLSPVNLDICASVRYEVPEDLNLSLIRPLRRGQRIWNTRF